MENSELRIIWMDVPWTTTHVTRELYVCLANDYHILIGRFSLSMKDFQVLKISLKQRSCQMFFCCCKCLWYGLHHHTGTQQEVKTRPWVPIRTLEILQVFLKTGPIWYFCLINQLKAQRLYRILWWSRIAYIWLFSTNAFCAPICPSSVSSLLFINILI